MKNKIIYPYMYRFLFNNNDNNWSIILEGQDVKSGDEVYEYFSSKKNRPEDFKRFKKENNILFINDLEVKKGLDYDNEMYFDIREHKGYNSLSEIKSDYAKNELFGYSKENNLNSIIETQAKKLPSFEEIQEQYYEMALNEYDPESIEDILMIRYEKGNKLISYKIDTFNEVLESIKGIDLCMDEIHKLLKK